ncbi:dihydrofolate reductase family protein [Algoriphagus sp. AGSA1]|uniref:dihydrofolate reductase family protein n=1 Tax=Algoriphagus sp. AGSA1 TaxID=2907213 RepID=UPI001F46C914|nr:dihydrofolate reductase family protein [Algoriphagus sp. AGSA1]MCE7057313.1 dihydrofolate reductase family protein [Algoriphagus sp. AGSA1]
MRKIILNLAVTLDGYIEGPNGEIDWLGIGGAPDDSGAESHFDKFLASIDTIFFGRVSYEKWGEYQPGENASPSETKLWEGVHSKKKYVFSNLLKTNEVKAELISSDVLTKVQEIKNQPGKDIWLYGGSSLITTFMNLGLVDSYLLAVFPVILGEGKPLFTNIKNRVGLTLKNSTAGSGVLLLEYETKR